VHELADVHMYMKNIIQICNVVLRLFITSFDVTMLKKTVIRTIEFSTLLISSLGFLFSEIIKLYQKFLGILGTFFVSCD
jgi:hypothetical protein